MEIIIEISKEEKKEEHQKQLLDLRDELLRLFEKYKDSECLGVCFIGVEKNETFGCVLYGGDRELKPYFFSCLNSIAKSGIND